METGTAIKMAMLEENLYRIANTPIHKLFLQIAPYLEKRQEAAKIYWDRGKSIEEDEQYEAMIEWCNAEIIEILNIQNKK